MSLSSIFLHTLFLILLLCPFVSAKELPSKVLTIDELKWGYLNPLRGDKSPGAADLWGNRIADSAVGMLVKFNKGFSSPPHIHNISYRGIVIEGLIHNDDPEAEIMWMSPGSFWTQPAGANHITAANGESNLIYLEIDSGPYLVKPSKEKFDNGELPINLDHSNMVWLGEHDSKILDNSDAELTHLWGKTKPGELGGSMLKFPPGFSGKIEVQADEFRAVIIKGQLVYTSSKANHKIQMSPGGYFDSGDKNLVEHRISTSSNAIIYVRTNGTYKVVSN